MPSSRNPANCLADIVENAERIDGYIAGLDQTQFELNGLVRDAVERCLERICEAAHRLGTNAEVLVPGQPWGEIRGMGIGCVMDTTESRRPSFGKPRGIGCLC
jgi:uncharacterized protein with HEPN domain